MNETIKVAILTGSTRPGRNNDAVAKWVEKIAKERKDASFELVDIADYHLPLLNEPIPPSLGKYSHGHTKAWSEKIAGFDAYVIVTPEYNHSTSAALKNAIDYLFAEWNDKAAGFVSYGAVGGVRAAEHLRAIMAEVMVATVRAQLAFFLATDFENYTTFKPRAGSDKALNTLLDQLIAWGAALKRMREDRRSEAAAKS